MFRVRGELCLLLVRASGFRQAERQFNREVAAELAAAFSKRLRNSLPPGAAIGRWSEEGFIAMLSGGKPEAMASAKRVADIFPGTMPACNGEKPCIPRSTSAWQWWTTDPAIRPSGRSSASKSS